MLLLHFFQSALDRLVVKSREDFFDVLRGCIWIPLVDKCSHLRFDVADFLIYLIHLGADYSLLLVDHLADCENFAFQCEFIFL